METKSTLQTKDDCILITIEAMAKKLSIGMTKCYEICRSEDFTPLRVVGGRKLVDIKDLLTNWLPKQGKGELS